MNVNVLVKGIIKNIPGIEKIWTFQYKTGGTESARYCYSIWMRHLIMAFSNGFDCVPQALAELGPGDSLGVGLAALLSGVNKYYAFDAVKFSTNERNIDILNELIDLLSKCEPIPGPEEFPRARPLLSRYCFPDDLFNGEQLSQSLNTERLNVIREKLKHSTLFDLQEDSDIEISYRVPWNDSVVLEPDSIDMALAQAVMEHVDNLKDAYECLYKWLKPGGLLSLNIDYKSHGTANEWNGHWKYSDFEWKLRKGRRTFLLNRQPHSVHTGLIRQVGFKIITEIKENCYSTLSSNQLALRYRGMSQDDLTTCGAFIQAIK